MPRINYKCNQCLKDFLIKYIFKKPDHITCPHCGSTSIQANNNSGCKNNHGFT